MARRLAAAAVLALASCNTAQACSGVPTYSVSVEAPTASSALIPVADPAVHAGDAAAPFGMRVNGVTRVQTRSSISVTPLIRRQGPVLCILHVAIRVVMTFGSAIQIYIRDALPPSSCAYRATLAHEHQHVAIAERARAAVLGNAYGLVGPVLRNYPTWQQDGDALTAEITAISQALNQALHENYASLARQWNQAIDTPDSYRSIARQCTDWR